MQTSPHAAAVDVRGLAKHYGARTALEGLTLQVSAGEVVVLLGPNGAGKTTALRILAGLIAPTHGTGSVAGVRLDSESLQPLRARVGVLTETPGLWERLTVRVNLLTYARLYGMPQASLRVEALLEQFGLADRATDRAGMLSKALPPPRALARALVGDPVVLLLDEPTSGLDPAAARMVRDAIDAARRRGIAVLLSTHQLDEAEALADRIAVLQRTLLAIDTPDGLRKRLAGPSRVVVEVDGDAARWAATVAGIAVSVETSGSQLDLSVSPGHDVPDLVAALVAAGARVRSVNAARPSLEAAYLWLVRRDG